VRLRDSAMIMYYGLGEEVSGMTNNDSGRRYLSKKKKKRRPSQLGILRT